MASKSTISEFIHLQIPLEEIVKATDNFADENIIGKGGFGNVYKGKLMRSGNLINISARRLDRRHGQGDVEFWTEISVLSSLKHVNIVSLVGFCDEKEEKIIISHYYPKGSLSMHLSDTTNLTWRVRLKISSGIVEAIEYLHEKIGESYYVIHRNINSSTILLDDNWESRLSGFEFSLKHPVDRKNHVFRCKAIGTRGYMDPEIEKTGGFTHKSDIYSLGIVLYEILCGRKAFDPKDNDMFLGSLAKFHYENDTLKDIINPDLWDQMDPDTFALFSKAAYHCLQEERAQRLDAPKVWSVVEMAHYAISRQLYYDDNDDDDNDDDDEHDEDDDDNDNDDDDDNDGGGNDDALLDGVGRESPNPKKVKGLEHMRIRLKDIQLATKSLIEKSEWGFEYIAELECFDKESMWSVEEMNEGKIPKRIYVVRIIKFRNGARMLDTEIEILSSCKHRNIEYLLGFCDEGPDLILVFESFTSATLYIQLYLGELRLTWEKRLKMCLEIAHGLNYIHYEMEDQKMVIHGAISSHNILFDSEKEIKITGFEKSLFLPPNQADDALYIKNTYPRFDPYLDPEYAKTGKLKRESDVYSFGVVLFEILCGKTANLLTNDFRNSELLSSVVRRWFYTGIIKKKIAPVLLEENGENKFYLNKGPNEESLKAFLKIACRCLAKTQNERPTMKVIIKELEKALSFQENNKDTFRMSLEEIKLATNDFSPDKLIGGGGFGGVYKGEVARRNGNGNYTIVAKRLDTSHGQGEQQYYNELQILYEYKHKNVIRLLGYSNETDEKIIVYEHACKGSLDKYLNDARLRWRNRLKICIDFATGLEFLHGGVHGKEVVIHRDIKAANILLFDDWKAKVGDFGLSIISTVNKEADYVIDRACGTKGYLDPLYLKSGFLTIESDIYSFGVVLFEILCGKSTFEIRKCEGRYLSSFIKHKFEEGKQDEVVFEALKKEIVPKSLTTFQNIAYQCLDDDREKRPSAKKVLAQLKKALEFQVKGFEHMRIPLKDILSATQNFTKKRLIEKSKLAFEYMAELECFDRESMWSVEEMNKGKIPKRNYQVIIKKFRNREPAMFDTEIGILSSCKHRNIQSLLGFCDEGPQMIFVFEFFAVPLYSQLEGLRLTWDERLKMCLEIAHGLNYIHYEMEDQKIVIHRAIRSRNILFDSKEGLKITGFRKSLFLPPNQADDALYFKNTYPRFDPYLDPEYAKTGKLKRESDVYSFGVVLFEILCGKAAIFLTNEFRNSELFSLVVRRWFFTGIIKKKIDSVLMGENGENKFYLNKGPNEESLKAFLKIACRCLAKTQNERPTMKVIIKELEKALSFQENNKDTFRMSLEEIKLATNDFSPDKLIGGGGFGGVYKGEVARRNGNGNYTIVAKRLDTSHGQGEQQYYNELQILYEYKHKNVIRLLGYSNETDEKIIVYEHACKGSLDKYLNDARLRWRNRLKICIDFATGLEFLHGGVHGKEVVIHRDIKAANILLFDDWKAKVGDFGLSIISTVNKEAGYVIDHACGTKGYLDPLYLKSGFLTIESDIYSFGVVLFEILCGKSTFEIRKCEGRYLSSFIKHKFEEGKQNEVVFEALKKEIVPKSLTTFQNIAYQCLDDDREKRPSAKKVLAQLKKALEFQDDENIGA